MKTKILLTVILSVVLVSCASLSTSMPTETIVPTATITLTLVPPTPSATSEPFPTPIPTETVPKDGDTKSVTENGYTYKYEYSAEYGQWMREVADFPLDDEPHYNFIPFRVQIADQVSDERNLLDMTHKDFTVADIPANGIFDPPPIGGVFDVQLMKRYFSGTRSGLSFHDQEAAITFEMLGKGQGDIKQAFLSITLSNGQEAQVKLSENSGIILTITDAAKIKQLGGDNLSTGTVDSTTYYAEVYGVDANGNELCRLAFDKSLNEVSDNALREAIFMFPSKLVEMKDQSSIGPSNFSFILMHVSTLSTLGRFSNADGTPDLKIDYLQPQQ